LVKSYISHISKLVDLDFRANNFMKMFCRKLFDMPKDQRIILSLIAKNGISTEYELGEHGFYRGLNRHSVHRKLVGRESTGNSLVENNYVVLAKASKFKNTGKIKKQFGLTLKGLLASLGEINFEDTYLAKNYFDYLQKDYKNKKLSSLSIQLIKYNILLMVAWHNSRGLSLSNLHDTKRYILDWILTNRLMNIDVSFSSLTTTDKIVIKIRERFFAVLSIVSALIKNLEGDYIADFSEVDFEDKNAINKRLWRYIQHWPFLLESIQTKDIRTYSSPSKQIEVLVNSTNLAKQQKSILSELKIAKISPDEKPQFPSEFIL